MFSNVKYIGDSYVNTTEGEYHYSNHHPAIISPKIFDHRSIHKKYLEAISSKIQMVLLRESILNTAENVLFTKLLTLNS